MATTLSLRVCSFETRRGEEMASLIRRHGGEPTLVPSLREIPLAENDEALRVFETVRAGKVNVFVFLTGVGTEALLNLWESRFSREEILQALQHCRVVVRGPKPLAVLRTWKINVDFRVPEPNTSREIVETLQTADLIAGKTIAVQEYGLPDVELEDALRAGGADVIPVPVYRWALPVDCEPLREAVRQTIAGRFDVLLFTSAQQVVHVLQIAEELARKEDWRQAANRAVIGSIGPTCSRALQKAGLRVDVEASPPRMGQLVAQTLAAAPRILSRKRMGE